MIKMRTNRDYEAVCCECGNGRDRSLELFDIRISGHTFTICDLCNARLLQKTLSADCNVNSKTKNKNDMEIIRARKKALGIH